MPERRALVMLDLDQFKAINDQHGHAVGDTVLRQAAQRARRALREGDWLGRWGGEEFLALLPETEADDAVAVADRIRRAFAQTPFESADAHFQVTVSAGVVCHPLDGTTTGELLGIADAALYEAKEAGRNRVQRPTRRGHRFYSMGAVIEQGLRSGRLRPAYQPIVDLRTGQVVGQEALARIVLDRGRVLPAADFIEVASLRHLIHRVDEHIFRCALMHCREQFLAGTGGLHFVNVSAGLLRRPETLASLAEVLEREQQACDCEDLSGHPLVIEITERDFIDPRQAREMLRPFLDRGVRLAIDDFGSGYSYFGI